MQIMDEGTHSSNLVEFALVTLKLLEKNDKSAQAGHSWADVLFDDAIRWGLAEYDDKGNFKIKDCTF